MRMVLLAALVAGLVGCSDDASTSAGGSSSSSTSSGTGGALAIEAGFVSIPPRDVTLSGAPIHLGTTARLFYNFYPADHDAETKPVFILFNGFAADIVRAFGTGPTTVSETGEVVPNPASLTQLGSILYLEPRQSGFSYDLPEGSAPTAADCSTDVFNEYVDAADVLLAALQFLDEHPSLQGRIHWVGESYAGVRIQWMLAYLRGKWSLSPFEDETLKKRIAGFDRLKNLLGRQVLLEPWLLGAAHAQAITNTCFDASVLAGVKASVGSDCAGENACGCATEFDRSAYNYTYTVTKQEGRVAQADAAHVDPEKGAKLFGTALDAIPGLSQKERAAGFKCSIADDTTPDQSKLVSLLGALPAGQSYYLSFTPLVPGKGDTDTPDWKTKNLVGLAFVDNLAETETLLTDGPRDMVVPERALVPGLVTLLGKGGAEESGDVVTVHCPGGDRTIDIRRYPEAGHMITMIAPDAFETDLAAWLAQLD